jgi:hypothetical protein
VIAATMIGFLDLSSEEIPLMDKCTTYEIKSAHLLFIRLDFSFAVQYDFLTVSEEQEYSISESRS